MQVKRKMNVKNPTGSAKDAAQKTKKAKEYGYGDKTSKNIGKSIALNKRVDKPLTKKEKALFKPRGKKV